MDNREKFPHVISSKEFATELMLHANWFSGIPDSVFKKILDCLEPFYNTTRENHALAMAFGAALGRKKPAILIQNSGLGLLIDALFGLQKLYKVGTLLIISNRGELEWEEIQHQVWGEKTIELLKLCNIKIFDLQKEGISCISKAAQIAFDENKIVSIIVHRGNIDE